MEGQSARPANRTRSKQPASSTTPTSGHPGKKEQDEKSPQSAVEKSSETAGQAIPLPKKSHKKRPREETGGGEAAAEAARRSLPKRGAASTSSGGGSSSGSGPVTVKQEAQASTTPRAAGAAGAAAAAAAGAAAAAAAAAAGAAAAAAAAAGETERPSRAAAALAKLAFSSSSASVDSKGGGSQAGGGNAAGNQSSTSNDGTTKKTYRKSHYVSEAPKRLELVADRHSKGTLLNATIRIKPSDVRMKAFDWSHRGDKFFALTLFSAKGERILPELYKDVPLRYRIAALETKTVRKGEEITTEEVLYDEAGQSTAGGLFYFRIPQFKIPGRYSVSFQFPTEAPPAYRKLDPVSQIVSVVPVDESSRSSSSSSNSNPSLLEGGGGPRGLGLGDLTRSTEKTRRMRSQGGPLGGSSVASSSSSAALLGGGGGAVLGGGGLGTGGGGGGIKRQQSLEEEFASLVEQSADFVLTLEDVEQKGRLVSLVIPGGLRLRLAEDWFVVTRRRHLVGSMPRGMTGGSGGGGSSSRKQQQQPRQWPNVGEVIRAYEKTLSPDPKGSKGEMGERLCTLFDGALGNLLLYRFEMNHYLGVLERLGVSKRPHQVWGAEHLLRLLAICPRLLAVQSRTSSSSSNSDDDMVVGGEGGKGAGGGVLLVEEAEEARVYLQGLLDYLAEKQDTLFAPYEEQPRDYGLDVARSVRPS